MRTALLVSSLALVVGACTTAPAVDSFTRALTPPVLLSEVVFDPPGSDGDNEYLELRCTPGIALDGYSVLIVDGDLEGTIGTVDTNAALTGQTCGSGGVFVIQHGTTYSGGGANYAALLPKSAALENGTQTILLLQGGSAPAVGSSADVGADGMLDTDKVTGTIIDAIAYSDGGASDVTYTTAVITRAAPLVAAMSRLPNDDTPVSAPAWFYGGALTGTPPAIDYDLDLSANFPAGGHLTPGVDNTGTNPDLAGADLASTVVDAATNLDLVTSDLKTTPDLVGADLVAPAVPFVLLNEVLADPPGSDGKNEFIELLCTPGAALDAVTLVILEGDNSGIGHVDFQKKLTGVVCGADGLVVLQGGSVFSGVADTTYNNTFLSTSLENGTLTVLLVANAVITLADVDADDDGTIDSGAIGGTILDAVGINDGDAGDAVYSDANLKGATFTAGAIARFAGNTDANSAAAWYFGVVDGSAPAFTFSTGFSTRSPNLPADAVVSPGVANSPPGDTLDFAGFSVDLAASTGDLANPFADLAPSPKSDLAKPFHADLAESISDGGSGSADLKKGGTTSGRSSAGCTAAPGDITLWSTLLVGLALAARRRRY